MPIYAYKCLSCGNDFERLRGMSQSDTSRDREIECPECGQAGQSKRKLSSFMALTRTDGVTRPANTSGGGSCCGGGCGCGH
jgi:putative FmdB family regulatory protein